MNDEKIVKGVNPKLVDAINNYFHTEGIGDKLLVPEHNPYNQFLRNMKDQHGCVIETHMHNHMCIIDKLEIVDEQKFSWFLLKWSK